MGRMGRVVVRKVRTWRGWEKLLFIRYEHGEGVKSCCLKGTNMGEDGEKLLFVRYEHGEDGEKLLFIRYKYGWHGCVTNTMHPESRSC